MSVKRTQTSPQPHISNDQDSAVSGTTPSAVSTYNPAASTGASKYQDGGAPKAADAGVRATPQRGLWASKTSGVSGADKTTSAPSRSDGLFAFLGGIPSSEEAAHISFMNSQFDAMLKDD